MGDESKPLLHSSASDNPPPNYQSSNTGDENVGGEDANGSSEQSVSCSVCSNTINIEDKRQQHVVKCLACGEATPIKNPPPGKKYVRCKCNCLLICNSSAPRVACPRPNCKYVNPVIPTPSMPPVPSIPGMARVVCVHCKDTFLFNTLKNVPARCPHCRRISSVGPEFSRIRGHWYLASFFIVLVIGVTLTGLTYQHVKNNTGLIAAYVSCFTLCLFCLGRSVYFYTMKVSAITGTV